MKFSAAESDLAIIIGGFVNGLGLIRSLAALERRVILVTTQPYDMAQHSRYVDEHHALRDIDKHPESLAALLQRHAREWAGAVVFPANDEAIASLSMHFETLSPCFRLVLPPQDCIPYLLDRPRMMRAAADVGMLLPRSHGRIADWEQNGPEIPFPVVVKPVKSGEFSTIFGTKLFACNDRSSLESCARHLAAVDAEGEIFDVVPGPDSDIYAYCTYLDQQGRQLAECTVRKLRQTPPFFGSARVAELSDHITPLREQSMELLRHIGFRGFAAVEFKRDRRDGSFRFFELNGRSIIYNALLRQGNLDIARMTFSDYVGGRARPVETSRWPGVWIHLHADVLRSLQNWRREALTLRDYLGPYRREKTFAVWSANDPGPFRAQWSRTFRQAARRVFRGADGTGNASSKL